MPQTVFQRRQELAEAAEADRVARDAAVAREAARKKNQDVPKPGVPVPAPEVG